MRDFPFNYVGDNLHVGMRMGSEAAVGLDEVVVDDSDHPKVLPLRVVVLGKTEVETAFEPVDCLIFVGGVPEVLWVRLTDE